MDPLDAHQRAHAAFADVLSRLGPDDLDRPSACEGWTVRDVARHVIGRNQYLSGSTEDVPDDVTALPGAQRAAAAAMQEVFGGPEGLNRTFEMAIGPIPGSVLIALRTTDAVVHAWDIASVTGQPTDIEPDVAAAMLDFSRAAVQPGMRQQGGPFGPEQPCPPGRPVTEQLAAFLGRRVSGS